MSVLAISIDDLKEKLKALRASVSRLRKKGLNTKLIDIKLLGVQPKIQIASATGDQKDFANAANYMVDIEKEVNALETQKDELN